MDSTRANNSSRAASESGRWRVTLARQLCSWRLATHPMPLASARPIQVRIDDRCNFPEGPRSYDGLANRGLQGTAQSPSAQVGFEPPRSFRRLWDGQLVTVRCYVPDGQAASDAVGNVSCIWLVLASPHGLIPDVDVGGGYSQAQLKKLGRPYRGRWAEARVGCSPPDPVES